MAKYLYLILAISLWGCNSTNTNSSISVKDSLSAIVSSEETILTYANGLNSLKETLEKIESPVYNQGDYTFYFVSYKKDSLPVIYEEHGSSGDYGFNNKTYYLENGEIVLYQEKSKQTIIGDKPSSEFKDLRIFYRNAIFLKADERSAESDSLLNSKSYTKIEESLIDKNKFYDFSRIEKGLNSSGEYALTFDRIWDQKSSKKFLMMNSSQGIESMYLIKKPDSLILKLEAQPETYKGSKLKIAYKRQGTNMVYEGEKN